MQPTSYVPATNFADDEADNVSGRSTVRTTNLDAEFEAIALRVTQIKSSLSAIQRDDAALLDGVVTIASLNAAVSAYLTAAGGTIRGTWLTATAYAVKDVVVQGTGTYICAVAHTSGVFATDLTAVKWVKLYDTQSFTAAQISSTPTGDVAASNVDSAIAELASEKLAKAQNLADLANRVTAFNNLIAGGGTLTSALTFSGARINEGKGADIASAITIDLDAATGNLVDVTGTTQISAVTLSEGREAVVRFTGTTTITNEVALILPGGATITTAAGDFATFRGYAGGVVRLVHYSRKSGLSLVSDSPALTSPLYNRSSKRQCAQTGSVSSTGAPNFLQASGANLDLRATTTPLVLSFAAGFGIAAGYTDWQSVISADANSVITHAGAANTWHIAAQVVDVTSVTWSQNRIAEQDGITFDRTRQSMLHFEQNGAAPLDDFGMTWTVTGAAINNTKPAYGSYSLNASGGGTAAANVKRAETADFLMVPPDSWEMSCLFFADAVPATNTQVLMCAVNNAGYGITCGFDHNGANQRAFMSVSSNGTSWDILNVSRGTTNLVVGTWYKFRAVFDALAGTYRLYVAPGGTAATPVWAAEVQEVTVSSSARVCATTRLIVGCWYAGGYGIGVSGYIDEFRLLPCSMNNTIETPSGYPFTVDSPLVYWYDPQAGLMRVVSAASAAAGTNPTMSSTLKVFIGETDTDGTNITAVRLRPYQARYVSALTAVVNSNNSTQFQHNLGTRMVRGECWAWNVETECGWKLGDRTKFVSGIGGSTNFANEGIGFIGRNTGVFNTYTALGLTGPNPYASTVTAAKWRTQFIAERAY